MKLQKRRRKQNDSNEICNWIENLWFVFHYLVEWLSILIVLYNIQEIENEENNIFYRRNVKGNKNAHEQWTYHIHRNHRNYFRSSKLPEIWMERIRLHFCFCAKKNCTALKRSTSHPFPGNFWSAFMHSPNTFWPDINAQWNSHLAKINRLNKKCHHFINAAPFSQRFHWRQTTKKKTFLVRSRNLCSIYS